MRGRDVAVAILNQMKVLDQEIAAARPLAEEIANFRERLRVDLPPLGRKPRTPIA
jgi:hypothetical protein